MNDSQYKPPIELPIELPTELRFDGDAVSSEAAEIASNGVIDGTTKGINVATGLTEFPEDAGRVGGVAPSIMYAGKEAVDNTLNQ